jgi:hypothetical protein
MLVLLVEHSISLATLAINLALLLVNHHRHRSIAMSPRWPKDSPRNRQDPA